MRIYRANCRAMFCDYLLERGSSLTRGKIFVSNANVKNINLIYLFSLTIGSHTPVGWTFINIRKCSRCQVKLNMLSNEINPFAKKWKVSRYCHRPHLTHRPLLALLDPFYLWQSVRPLRRKWTNHENSCFTLKSLPVKKDGARLIFSRASQTSPRQFPRSGPNSFDLLCKLSEL